MITKCECTNNSFPKDIEDAINIAAPHLICGVSYYPEVGNIKKFWCVNTSELTTNYSRISETDLNTVRELGTVAYAILGRMKDNSECKEREQRYCNELQLPVLSLSYESKTMSFIFPDNEMDLVGRPFIQEKFNCYTLIQDFYKQKYDIKLNDYQKSERDDDIFLNNIEREGFYSISKRELIEGDVILMQINGPTANHTAIYLGEDKILNHMGNRPSGYNQLSRFSKYIVGYYRHLKRD
ncbi:NlpC/P60 family protein [Photorhabdus sp. CRCIA-P01]|uniref:NlpC/P60 family protein n=1 Tax=Photorhabdus sp. CRCIA-P01 TaxID=2019570 RepID=UPI0013005BB7|nr:NlpC/P60 family protein [Photorhabdus sp. CRCIA-P01]